MSVEVRKKRSLRAVYALVAIAIVLGAVAISLGVLNSFERPSYVVLSGVKETQVTFVISSTGNTTRTSVYENNNWTASYEQGKPLTLEESLYTTSQKGVTTITSIVSNTTGFVFTGSSVSLPAYVPYAADISNASQRVQLTFQTPSTPYVGDFEYTVYYNLTIP